MQNCPTFLLVRPTFAGEKLLEATCIFTKIELQIIASLLYKIGAHFSQYFGYLSQKLGEDHKKKRSLLQIRTDFRRTKQKKVLVWTFFISQKMLSKPFHEKINRAKRPCGPYKTASRAKCGPRGTGWAALV